MPRETKAQREARLAAEAQQKEREAQEATDEVARIAEGEQPPEPEQPAQAQPEQPETPQVHVLVERNPDGAVEVDVVATGDVRVTEITDILRLALIKWDQKSGLGKANR